MTPEEKKIMVKFVHNSTHKSKDLLVSVMLNAHPTIANSRAHAMRELDVIADKTKNPHASGSLWVVKDSIIKALDMNKSHLVSNVSLNSIIHSRYILSHLSIHVLNQYTEKSSQTSKGDKSQGSKCTKTRV